MKTGRFLIALEELPNHLTLEMELPTRPPTAQLSCLSFICFFLSGSMYSRLLLLCRIRSSDSCSLIYVTIIFGRILTNIWIFFGYYMSFDDFYFFHLAKLLRNLFNVFLDSPYITFLLYFSANTVWY